MTEREALKLALEALEAVYKICDVACVVKPDGEIYLQPVILECRKALAQPEQEPVEVFLTDQHQMGFKVGVQSFLLDYWPNEQAELEFMKTQLLTAFARATPPQRPSRSDIKPLTHEQIEALYETTESVNWARSFARAIEAAVWEKQK
jgi:hypothetical protein